MWHEHGIMAHPPNGLKLRMHPAAIKVGLPHLRHYTNNLAHTITVSCATPDAITKLFYGHCRSYDIWEPNAADSIDILGVRSGMNITGLLSFISMSQEWLATQPKCIVTLEIGNAQNIPVI